MFYRWGSERLLTCPKSHSKEETKLVFKPKSNWLQNGCTFFVLLSVLGFRGGRFSFLLRGKGKDFSVEGGIRVRHWQLSHDRRYGGDCRGIPQGIMGWDRSHNLEGMELALFPGSPLCFRSFRGLSDDGGECSLCWLNAVCSIGVVCIWLGHKRLVLWVLVTAEVQCQTNA